MSKGHELVKVGDSTLSVLEKPPPDCEEVVKARKNLMGSVDLKGFVTDLTTVGKFIRIAYNGVAGETDLQILMRNLGFEIAELCDDSSLAITKFRAAADSIVTDMTGAYEFFLEDMEEMAFTAIDSMQDSAKDMAVTAEALQLRFQEQKKKVLDVCEKTAKMKGVERKELELMKQKQKEKEAEQERISRDEELAAKEKQALQKAIEDAAVEEEKVAESLAPNAADVVLGVITAGVYPALRQLVLAISMKRVQEKIDKLHERKKKEIERQRKDLAELEKCAKEIAKCSGEQNIQNTAITALHGAVGALGRLAATMQKAATFWKSMQNHCDEQAKGKLEGLLETAKQYETPHKRQIAYRSNPVKKRAVQQYAAWVAVEVVCDEYIKQIAGSREELYRYLSENPTVEESKDRIGLLCHEFSEEIKEQNQMITQRIKEIEEQREKEKLKEIEEQREKEKLQGIEEQREKEKLQEHTT